jgi:Iron-containing redox enzyme
MQTLSQYSKDWTTDYQNKTSKLKLFQPQFAKNLTWLQKQKFALAFYHIRGTFYKLLWYIGSIAPSKQYKDVILKNISEEFGQTLSHETWYCEFAQQFDVDIKSEILDEKNNFDWIRDFNKTHLRFALTQDFNLVWAAFGAYEKLDNDDYDNLYNLACNIGSSKRGLVFFDIHRHVEHYESVDPLLRNIWENNPETVKKGFEFIANHQLAMWERLGEYVSKST